MLLNSIPVTDLQLKITLNLMHLLCMRRYYCRVWNRQHWTDPEFAWTLFCVWFKMIQFPICTPFTVKTNHIPSFWVTSSIRHQTPTVVAISYWQDVSSQVCITVLATEASKLKTRLPSQLRWNINKDHSSANWQHSCLRVSWSQCSVYLHLIICLT